MATQLEVATEKQRFSGQCCLILGMLMTGRKTNADLAKHALKYSGRISELRKRGHDIRVVARNYETGLVWYALFSDDGQEMPR
jgi:hypothetical protein